MTTQTIAGAVPATRDRILRRVIAVALGAFAVAMAARVQIPLAFSPVPITLQGLAVVLVGLLLGSRLGAAALIAYLAIGIAGVPIFATATFGSTGGYLLAFPLGAWLAGYLATHATSLPMAPRYLIAALAGMVIIHLGGWSWLAIVLHSPGTAFALGVAPFIVIDLAKAVLAAGLALGLGGRVRRVL
jgi:biotin transport system substrate-specific component